MRIKQYLAPDMRRAMRMVRDEQGPDAVILSSRRTDGGIEVVAAIDYDENLIDTKIESTATAQTAAPLATTNVAEIERAAETKSYEPTFLAMKQEVTSLRHLLESQLASLAWNDTVRRHPVRAGVLRKLTALGLTTKLATSLSDEAEGADIETAFAAAVVNLESRFSTLDTEIIDEPGAVALVGPTGVGKTTSIAKLAARFALKHGANELALLTTDGFRIGAQEQLTTFGRILGVPVQLVRDGKELCTALAAHSDKRLVLIDSAGVGQRDQRINRELGVLRKTGTPLRVLLTLSCQAQTAVLEEAVRAFSDLAPCGCVLTKLDEAASLGGAISVLVGHGLPLAYVADGQNVPEDLHWARSKRLSLIERAVQLGKPDDQQAAHLGALSGYGEVRAHA